MAVLQQRFEGNVTRHQLPWKTSPTALCSMKHHYIHTSTQSGNLEVGTFGIIMTVPQFRYQSFLTSQLKMHSTWSPNRKIITSIPRCPTVLSKTHREMRIKASIHPTSAPLSISPSFRRNICNRRTCLSVARVDLSHVTYPHTWRRAG